MQPPTTCALVICPLLNCQQGVQGPCTGLEDVQDMIAGDKFSLNPAVHLELLTHTGRAYDGVPADKWMHIIYPWLHPVTSSSNCAPGRTGK